MNVVLNFSPLALFLIMLGVGMSISIKDFIEVFKNLKILLIGLLSQIVILPLIGFLFVILMPVDLVFKLGIILITCVPSSVTSNYITKLVDGNIALSVSLTSITASLSFITIPFILIIIAPIATDEAIIFQELNFIKMSLGLLSITSIPIFVGMVINIKFSIFAEKIKNIYSIFSLLLFIVVISAAWISEWNTIISLYKSIGFLVAGLSVVILIVSFILVNLFKLSEANRKTIIIESFVQNAAMAIIVGGVAFGLNSGYLAIAALYALLQYKILLFLWAGNNFFKKFYKI
jgi:BASS family bile acid:Na+ symporter